MKLNHDREEYKRDYSFLYQAIKMQIEKRGIRKTYHMISKIEERLLLESKDRQYKHTF